MQIVPSEHPPGLVGITSGDLTRYTEFVASLQNTLSPEHSQVVWERGYDVCVNRNKIIHQMLATPIMQWVWLLDDDHIWDGDLLMRLLDRGKDVIHPLVSMRYPPFKAVSCEPAPGSWSNGSRWRPWKEIPLTGLSENHVIGAAGLLIRRPVLEKLEKNWFDPGKLDPGHMQEDTYFCKKVYDAGFQIWQDNENKIGHLATCSVWPGPPDGVDIRFDFARTNIHVNLDMQEKWLKKDTSAGTILG